MKQAVALTATAVIVLGALALTASAAGPASTVRVSVSSAGEQGDRDSYAAESAPTARTSCSTRRPGTSSRATPTAATTSSSPTGRPAPFGA